METVSATATRLRQGRLVADGRCGGVRHLHAREDVGRASADGADDRRVHRHRGAAEARAARDQGLGAGARADPTLRRAGAARRQRARTVRRTRSRQGVVADRRRADRPVRVVRDQLRRTGQPLHPSHRPVRHRRTEAAVPAEAGERRTGWRLRAQRVRIRIGRPGGADARHESGRRIVDAQRREDVDHQRRLRRRHHRLCQGRR